MKSQEGYADLIAKVNEDNDFNNQQKNINPYREIIQLAQSQNYKFNRIEWEAIQSSIEKDSIYEEQLLLPAEEWIGKFINLAEMLFEYGGRIEDYLEQWRNNAGRRSSGIARLTKSVWANINMNQNLYHRHRFPVGRISKCRQRCQ